MNFRTILNKPLQCNRAACLLVTLFAVCSIANASPSVKMINGNAVKLVVKKAQHAVALAPEDWTITTNAQASTVELQNADRSQYAGWMIVGINRAMQAYYGPMYGDTPTSAITFLKMMLTYWNEPTDPQYTGTISKPDAYFTVRTFESSTRQGIIAYHAYPTGGINYIESVFMAFTNRDLWKTKGGIAVQVASSIQAVTQLLPPSDSPTHSGSKRSGNEKTDPSAAIDRSYNKELGWQTVHDPATGENYTVEPAKDYNETGPDGPGYYRRNGNDIIKLEVGASQ